MQYLKFAGPLAQGVLDLVFAFLGSLYDPSAREKGGALGGIRRGNTRVEPAPNPRRTRAAATPLQLRP